MAHGKLLWQPIGVPAGVRGSDESTRPNTRMQRTRSSPSALRSPLMRWPLGPRGIMVALALVVASLGTGCGDKAPTEPQSHTVAGKWEGNLLRSPCMGDWSRIELRLEQSGESVTGIVQTNDGQQFSISGMISNGTGQLQVTLPPNTESCSGIGFGIRNIGQTTLSAQVEGRCCGTLEETVEFVRTPGA
jgi:hypothetical protein